MDNAKVKELVSENRRLVAKCNAQADELKSKDEIINSMQEEIENLKMTVDVGNYEVTDDELASEDEPEVETDMLTELENEFEMGMLTELENEEDILAELENDGEVGGDTADKEINPFSCFWDTLYSVLHKAIAQDAFIAPAKAAKSQPFESMEYEQLTSYVDEAAGHEYADEFIKLGTLFGVLNNDAGKCRIENRLVAGKRVRTVGISKSFVNYLRDNCR